MTPPDIWRNLSGGILTKLCRHRRVWKSRALRKTLLLFSLLLIVCTTVSAEVPTKSVTILSLYSVAWLTITVACAIEALLIVWLLILYARRRNAEREKERFAHLAQAEHQHLDEVVSEVPGIVWEALIDSKTQELKTTFVSNRVQTMLGYSAEDMLGAPELALNLMATDHDREVVLADIETVVKSGKDGMTQFRWRAKDGRIVWAETSLNPILNEAGDTVGLRGVTLDITRRKVVEEALERQEIQLSGIIESAMDGIITVDENQRIVLFNQAAEKIFECSRAEALGQPFARLIPERFREAYKQQLLKQSSTISDLFGLRSSGEEFPMEASISYAQANREMLSTVIVRDITDRKRAIDELRHSEERFAKAFRANPQPMSLSMLDSGVILDVNDSFLAISGFHRDEVVGHTPSDLGFWETPEVRADLVNLLKQRGSVVNAETKLRTKSGSLRTLLTSAEQFEIGGQRCLLLASTDVTDRVLAQQALRESEARFRNLADNAPVMIWMSDESRTCTYLNKQWLNFTGKSLEDQLGDGRAKGIHPDDYQNWLQTYVTSFDARRSFEIEYRLRRADGQFRWVLDCAAARVSPNGEFLGFIGSAIDITERKESEVALHKAHEELSQLKNQLEAENIYLQEEIQLDQTFGEIVGQSDAIKYVLAKISQVAALDSTVLISGETGTGKELIARAIHDASPRRNRPLIKVNCAALSPTLIESELFGHEKGAFTGAGARKLGRFELADSGTIFLDEIGELPLELQVRLLRVIQEGEFERVGGSKTIKVNVRVIAATNRNLKMEVENGRFREDLWYRLNVFPITAPPLRQRKDDIPLLVEHFVRKSAKKFGKTITAVSPRAMQSLQSHSWPGNVRELANVIERALIHTQGSVLHLADSFEQATQEPPASKTLEEMERDYIVRTLENTGWRIEGAQGAAKILGLNPSTLRARLSKLGIQRPHTFSNKPDDLSPSNHVESAKY